MRGNIELKKMKRLLLITAFLIVASSAFSQKKWEKEGIKIPPPICYGSEESQASFIQAPDEFLKHLKSTQEKKSTINVTYIGFSNAPTAKAAFQYAVDIWQYLVASPVPMYMVASWSSLDDGVLGSCGPYIYYENFEAAPYRNCYYPVALVAKLEGKSLTDPTNPDMIASFNKDVSNWYYGTDGKTPAGDYDFVSVVLHEIAHGLGFTGFFYEQSNQGGYGDALPFPGVFDEFIVNGDGERLVDLSLFSNPSNELHQQITSDNLYSESQTANLNNATNGYPRLYAPSIFDEGSSVYHLNELTYGVGDTNSLMTPYFKKNEAIHNPGPLTLGIFADMGWEFTQLIHDRLKDIEAFTDPIPVEASIKTDSEIDSASVILIYSDDSFENVDTIPMAYNNTKELFVADLDNLNNAKYSYYLSVKDTSGRSYSLPAGGSESPFEFTIGPDTEKPLAMHKPIKFMMDNDLSKEVFVEASDNIGIQDVRMEYYVNNGDKQDLVFSLQGDTIYQAILQLGNLSDGDSVLYKIVVTDSSSNSNQTTLPRNGVYKFFINGFLDPVTSYSNDFNTSSKDFISADFTIGTELFFDNGALNSPHPYPSPEMDMDYNFSAVLKYPIILDDKAIMSYNEVVLVEPGTGPNVFGNANFFDYVIVEGSKNGIDGWKPLLDGYDSRANSNWETIYSSSDVGGNSASVGKASYYVNRSFKMTENGNFSKNDTIYVRFRLFSDPYAHGWGWAIDDLEIQDPSTGVDNLTFSPGELQVYPNPVSNDLFIKGQFKAKVGQLSISVYNGFGQLVSKDLVDMDSNQFSHKIDVHLLQSGLYLLNCEFENGQTLTRKFVKQ